MERSHFFIFVAIGLVCGVTLEILKAPHPTDVRLAGFSKFETLLDEGRPVYVADAGEPLKLPSPKAVKVPDTTNEEPLVEDAGVPTPSPTPTVKPSPTPTPEEIKKKAAEDKKKAAEKKKKDAEEKKKKEQEEVQAQEQAESQAKADTEAAASAAAAQANQNEEPIAPAKPASAGVSEAQGAATANTAGESAQYWEKILLAGANPTKTAEFIKAFKSHQIAATVFYAVAEAMMADSQPTIREQGELALASTPSPQSFTLLSTAANQDTNAGVKSTATQDLQTYAQIQNLQYLNSVIAGSNPQAAIEAMSLVQQSAGANLGTVGATSVGGTVNGAANVNYFNPFIATLEEVERNNVNAGVRAAAGQTLTYLQGIMGNTQVSANP